MCANIFIDAVPLNTAVYGHVHDIYLDMFIDMCIDMFKTWKLQASPATPTTEARAPQQVGPCERSADFSAQLRIGQPIRSCRFLKKKKTPCHTSPHACNIRDIRDIRSARISLEIQHQVYLHLSVIKTRLLALRLTQPLYISGVFFLALRDLWVSWRPKPVHRIHSCGGSQRFLICHGDPRSPFPSGGVQKYNTHLIMMISNLETTIKAPAAERGLQLLS